MKTIVISGSYSNVGKTTLAINIAEVLNSSKVKIIKIGHNPSKPDKNITLFHNCSDAMSYISYLEASNTFEYLIIESNSILSYFKPDLTIFIRMQEEKEKKSAKLASASADILIDQFFDIKSAQRKLNKVFDDDILLDILIQQYKFLYENQMK